MKRHRINYALAATLVASGVTLADAAAQCGAKNADNLRVGLWRKGVTATRARNMEPTEDRTRSITLRLATQASELLKDDLSGLLQKQVTALKKTKMTGGLKRAAEVAQVLEPLARTAKIVHNWGESGPNGVVLVGEMDGTDRAPIDLPSTDVKLVSTSVEVTPQEAAPSREFDL